jgi:hypothetical protein
MSLISTQNFVAPFRSKFQIGAILVMAALVGMVRFAGHSEHGGEHHPMRPSAVAAPSANDDVTKFLADRARSKRREPQENDKSIESLFDGESARPIARKEGSLPGNSPEEPEKLNDIKRKLGLE